MSRWIFDGLLALACALVLVLALALAVQVVASVLVHGLDTTRREMTQQEGSAASRTGVRCRMPTVWIRADPSRRTRFHRDPRCWQLTKSPAVGQHWDLLAVDLNDVDVRPCRTCYPDAPKITVFKGYCEWHQSTRPCVHNGGTKVTYSDGRYGWVWPDTNQMPAFRKRA